MMNSKEVLGQDDQEKKKINAQNMVQNALTDEAKMHLNKFELNFKNFYEEVNYLSKKQLRRILTKLIARPILDNKFNLGVDKLENKMYNMCVEMDIAKINAMIITMSQKNNKGE